MTPAVALFWIALSAPAQVESADPHGMRLNVLAGSVATLSSRTDAAVVPLLRVGIEAPLTTLRRGPTFDVVADVGGLPGDSVQAEKPETYRSLEFRVGVSQPLGRKVLFSVYAVSGFASRRPHDESQARDRAPRYAGLGLLFQSPDRRGRLAVTCGGDQRLDGEWGAAVQIAGHVALWRPVKGIQSYLVGDAILGLDLTGVTTNRRDVVRLGFAVGR